ncbi:ABC-type multidrug transport system fused ATPase/permease subunit [Paenibacillus sp. 1182]|nr:ABC-type multidrug transport system fused ATPase/permease subunit [Paenibacillus sp. 1182]
MVVEQGQHDELLDDNGLDARLWKRQHEGRES